MTAKTDVYLWRHAEQVGEPTDTEEVGRLEWVPLRRIPELALQQQLLEAYSGSTCRGLDTGSDLRKSKTVSLS